MVTINTAEDILTALRSDPELLRQVRLAIMTDDVLALPEQVQSILQTQSETLADIADLRRIQNEILADIADLRQTQNRILADTADLRQTQNEILADTADLRQTQNEMLQTQREILRHLENLHTRFGRMDHDFRNFRGNFAETAVRKSAFDIAILISEEKGLDLAYSSVELLNQRAPFPTGRQPPIRRASPGYQAQLRQSGRHHQGGHLGRLHILYHGRGFLHLRRQGHQQGHVPQPPLDSIYGQTGIPRHRRGFALTEPSSPCSIPATIFWYPIEEEEMEPEEMD